MGWKRGHRTLPSDHRTLEPQRPVLRGWPRVLLESRVPVSNGYLRNTGRSVGPHRTRPVHIGLKLREVCKLSGSPDAEHRTVRAHRTHIQRGSQNARTPDAEHRTHSGASGAHCFLWSSTPDAKGQRPVSVSQRKHSRDFSGAIENIHLFFSKAPNLAEQTRREGERNPNPSQP